MYEYDTNHSLIVMEIIIKDPYAAAIQIVRVEVTKCIYISNAIFKSLFYEEWTMPPRIVSIKSIAGDFQ